MARDEILAERDERNESAVAADGRLSARSGIAVEVAADQLGRARQPVAQQHFGVGVVVAANKVRRFRVEDDKASVGTEVHALRGNPAVTVPLTASGRDAHAFGRSSQPIAHEHVGRQVRIAGHEIIGKRHEANEATVRCHSGASAAGGHESRSHPAGRIALDLGAAHADQFKTGDDDWARPTAPTRSVKSASAPYPDRRYPHRDTSRQLTVSVFAKSSSVEKQYERDLQEDAIHAAKNVMSWILRENSRASLCRPDRSLRRTNATYVNLTSRLRAI